MKKIIALVLALMIIMSMTACGAKPAETTPAAPAATEAAAAATEAAAEPAGDVKTYKSALPSISTTTTS